MDPAYNANGQVPGAVQYDQNGVPIQDPNAVQQVDPNNYQYQQYQDPNAYQQYVDPNAAQQYVDPNAVQQYVDPNAAQQYVDPTQAAAPMEAAPVKEKGKSFLYYLFAFITVGFSYLGKYGTDAFNPNAMVENVTTNPDGTVVLSKTAKRVELQKEKIRNSPKYIELKKRLQEQLVQEGVTKLDEPVVFEYLVMDSKARVFKGRFNGCSKNDINAFLVNEGYEVFSIETSDRINFLYGSGKFLSIKLNNKDLIFWLTQLSTYIKAGIPLIEAVRILANQMSKGKNDSKSQVFHAIVYELSMGTVFSDALAKQGRVFPPLLINMLKAAEATGNLEETLDEMAAYYTEINETKQQMKSAMTYPLLVLVFAFGITGFILVYIVPQFQGIYESAGLQLTGLTVMLLNLADFLKKYLLLLFGIIIIIIISFIVVYKKVQPFRKAVQFILMKMPVVGNVVIYNELTIFTKTFASLLRNNVFITECIDILSKITQNEIFKDTMYDTIGNIARGEKISASFAEKWYIPDIAYYMIRTGESTGDLANMMQKVSDYYGKLHKSMIESMKSIIEPIMIVVVAVLVGGILVAVIMPMFQLYEKISV